MKSFKQEIRVLSKKMTFITMACISLIVAGCNTMEGAGTDIQKAGKALENSAERNKDHSPPCSSCPPSTHSKKVRN